LGERHGLEVESLRIGIGGGSPSAFQAECEVFLGSADKVHDPSFAVGFTVTILDGAVVNLTIEQKSAIAHETTLYEIFENLLAFFPGKKGKSPGFKAPPIGFFQRLKPLAPSEIRNLQIEV
jgi:hypothetical protein